MQVIIQYNLLGKGLIQQHKQNIFWRIIARFKLGTILPRVIHPTNWTISSQKKSLQWKKRFESVTHDNNKPQKFEI